MRKVSLFVAALMMSSSIASAATLSSVQGDVLVNTGNGFTRAVQGQTVRAGDRVMVGSQGGSATITYDPLCFERVERGRVVTVQSDVSCNAGAPSLGGGLPAGGLIAGGAAVIGGGILIWQATKSSSP